MLPLSYQNTKGGFYLFSKQILTIFSRFRQDNLKTDPVIFTKGSDLPAMQLDDLSGNGKTDTTSACLCTA